jgi:hypothetical protein
LVRFGFLGQKQVQTGLAQFWLDFSGLARFFSVWVRFGFFFAYKTEPAGFFKILIGFFCYFFF